MKGKNWLLVFFGIVVLLVVALAVALPILLDVNRYKDQVSAQIESATGKPVSIGRLALTVWPTLSVQVDDFELGNGRGFPKGHLLKTERIYAVLDLGALLDRKLRITSVEIDRPDIHLLSGAHGRWNFAMASRQPAGSIRPVSDSSSFSLGTISSVKIVEGELRVAGLTKGGRVGKPYFGASHLDCDFVDVDLSFLDHGQSSNFPLRRQPSFRLVQGAGLRDAAENRPIARGTIRANSLILGPFHAAAARSKVSLFEKEVLLEDWDLEFYEGKVAGNFSTNWAGEPPRYHAHLTVRGVNGGKFMEAFPDRRGKMTGTLDGELELRGVLAKSPDPLHGMQGSGKLTVKHGRLPWLKLNEPLQAFARKEGVPALSADPGAFSLLTSDVQIAQSRITSEKVRVEAEGLRIQAAGTVIPAGKGNLSYQGVAEISMAEQPWMLVLTALTEATYADGVLRVPFTLSGTFAAIKFGTKARRDLGRQLANQLLSSFTSQKKTGERTEASPPTQATPEKPDPKQMLRGLREMFRKKRSPEKD